MCVMIYENIRIAEMALYFVTANKNGMIKLLSFPNDYAGNISSRHHIIILAYIYMHRLQTTHSQGTY